NQCVFAYSIIMAMLRLISNLTIRIKTGGGSATTKALNDVSSKLIWWSHAPPNRVWISVNRP
ncbi:MAG: hypothetical protein N0C86_19300, partial [Candidatus Thiodiazotropha taylori]|nr:hypothetical protein [Candidatus Thiodiazotropha taylori]MCW4328147.1 hypothetical protein [Candidatus Thiodiazotropha taylori]